MVSLISLILSWFQKKEIIEVRRMPIYRVLRAHLVGLTFGMLTVITILSVKFLILKFYLTVLYLIIFGLGTYIGGGFVILTAIVCIISFFVDGTVGENIIITLLILSKAYFIGYAFGGIFATFYNDLLFLYLISFGKKHIKISFAFKKGEPFQIIKSPKEREESVLLEVLKPITYYTKEIWDNYANQNKRKEMADQIAAYINGAFEMMSEQERISLVETLSEICSIGVGNFEDNLNKLEQMLVNLRKDEGLNDFLVCVELKLQPLIEIHLKKKERKLYSFDLDTLPAKPYTIAFVANPNVLRRNESSNDDVNYQADPDNYYRDPIMDDLDLFIHSVDRALINLERDDVLGRPEIWSRVRILTIFDEDIATDENRRKLGLLGEYQDTVVINNRVIENLIDPLEQMNDLIGAKLPEYQKDDDKITIHDIDVIYALTAAPEHDRSTAHYSDWKESRENEPDPKPDRPRKDFNFEPNPQGIKNSEITEPTWNYPDENTPWYIRGHEDHPEYPGRIALNVIGARDKTFIHEFAHAMSSAYRGAIVDEYSDQFVVEKNDSSNGTNGDNLMPFYINRIERNRRGGTLIPVHKCFAKYNGVLYHSDLEHPSSEEEWVGYFPERYAKDVGCTMDRTVGRYQFDKLISTFMYDRIIAKLNRK